MPSVTTHSHHQPRRIPREETPPPEEEPLSVEDDIFTADATSNRINLANCIETLAEKIKVSLEKDAEANKRFARRIRLRNYTQGKRPNSRICEHFLVKLPLSANCWNDYDAETIELSILRTIGREVGDDGHIWFRVCALIDDFIDPMTKDFMERLDRGEVLFEARPPNGGQPSPSRKPIAQTRTKPHQSTSFAIKGMPVSSRWDAPFPSSSHTDSTMAKINQTRPAGKRETPSISTGSANKFTKTHYHHAQSSKSRPPYEPEQLITIDDDDQDDDEEILILD